MTWEEALAEAFWRGVRKTNSCWLWKGATNRGGYGFLTKLRRRVPSTFMLAHRASYFLAYGDFKCSLFILHKCNRAECVNPEHLYAGTHADNTQDARIERLSRIYGYDADPYGIKELW